MVHWPKTIVANVVTIAIALIAGLALIQSAIALSARSSGSPSPSRRWSSSWPSWCIAEPRPRAIWPWPTPRRSRTCSPQWNSRRDLEAARLERPVERSGSTPPSSAEKAGDTGVDAVVPV